MTENKTATARGTSLPISLKHSVEIANFIKGKSTEKAKKRLANVLAQKEAIPYKRYNHDLSHKPGKMAGGRYPLKAIEHFMELIESVEANARNKGLVGELKIITVIPNNAGKAWHYGRKRSRLMKKTHLFIEVSEMKEKPKKEANKK